jgi:hypothetical protein
VTALEEYRKALTGATSESDDHELVHLADAAIAELEDENERLQVCGTCARCRAAGVCQSDWPLRSYATAIAPDKGLHSECWIGGALGWVAYWTEPEEEKQRVLADMEATGYEVKRGPDE